MRCGRDRAQSVLVYAAAGGMGNALIDLAKAAGLDRHRRGRQRGKGALSPVNSGADHVIDRKS